MRETNLPNIWISRRFSRQIFYHRVLVKTYSFTWLVMRASISFFEIGAFPILAFTFNSSILRRFEKYTLNMLFTCDTSGDGDATKLSTWLVSSLFLLHTVLHRFSLVYLQLEYEKENHYFATNLALIFLNRIIFYIASLGIFVLFYWTFLSATDSKW